MPQPYCASDVQAVDDDPRCSPLPRSSPSSKAGMSAADSPMRKHSFEEDLPAHVSPGLPPLDSTETVGRSHDVPDFSLSQPQPYPPTAVPSYLQSNNHRVNGSLEDGISSGSTTPGPASVPPSHLSPAFTPPATPGTGTPAIRRESVSVPVDSSDVVNGGLGSRRPKLLESLPAVNCVVRARIPT